jgi:selenide,water dikinase
LSGLEGLTSIGEDLNIHNNSSLASLRGIEELNSIGKDLVIDMNELLTTLEGLGGLNSIGEKLAKITGVKAMTDVTGFSLVGHLSEMCEGSNLTANIDFHKIPKLSMLEEYIEQKCMPGGTFNNWNNYGKKVDLANEAYMPTLCDPQTSGGLLIAVEESACKEVELLLQENNLESQSFGHLTAASDSLIRVK